LGNSTNSGDSAITGVSTVPVIRPFRSFQPSQVIQPLQASLEESVGSKYPWNSYQAYIMQNNDLVDTGLVLSEFSSIDDFAEFHNFDSNNTFLDIHTIKRRLPDDVAIEIIKRSCKVEHPTNVSNFTLIDRRNAIFLLNRNGISVRQINRLTGIPRGVIDRILSNKL